MAGETQSLKFFAISLHDKCVGNYRLIQSFHLIMWLKNRMLLTKYNISFHPDFLEKVNFFGVFFLYLK